MKNKNLTKSEVNNIPFITETGILQPHFQR
jgi:hypothetical protein